MQQGTKMAKLKATGKTVEVYQLKRADPDSKSNPPKRLWCNYNDCTTEYKNSELIFS